MGVFDGGAYRVYVYRSADEDPDETVTTDNPRELVERLRRDPEVRAVETHEVHYVVGGYQGDLSFGNRDEEDDE
ncbi:hypothetical protein ACFWMJ_23505 [Streptomyces hawaiiensis]|uniref:hypothetical protein n=1 Tax=Streptomyces hawaiiensis TaxID=67305 RepID=UPI00364F5C93